MTFNDIIAALDDIADLLHEIEVETVKRIGEAGVEYAISQSMGNYSLAELADLGYPYSKRHYGGVVGYGDSVDGFNPEQTNVQSGEFVESWSWHHTGRGTGIIENTAPVADILMEGTDKMVPRRVDDNVARHMIAFIIPYEINGITRDYQARINSICNRTS